MTETQLNLTLKFIIACPKIQNELSERQGMNPFETVQARINYIQEVYKTYIKPLTHGDAEHQTSTEADCPCE